MRFQKIGMRLKNVLSKKCACGCEQGFTWINLDVSNQSRMLIKGDKQEEQQNTHTQGWVFTFSGTNQSLTSRAGSFERLLAQIVCPL